MCAPSLGISPPMGLVVCWTKHCGAPAVPLFERRCMTSYRSAAGAACVPTTHGPPCAAAHTDCGDSICAQPLQISRRSAARQRFVKFKQKRSPPVDLSLRQYLDEPWNPLPPPQRCPVRWTRAGANVRCCPAPPVTFSPPLHFQRTFTGCSNLNTIYRTTLICTFLCFHVYHRHIRSDSSLSGNCALR